MKQTDVTGILSIVFGVMAVCLVCCAPVSGIFALVAIILAIVNLFKTPKKTLSIIGLSSGVSAIILCAVVFILRFSGAMALSFLAPDTTTFSSRNNTVSSGNPNWDYYRDLMLEYMTNKYGENFYIKVADRGDGPEIGTVYTPSGSSEIKYYFLMHSDSTPEIESFTNYVYVDDTGYVISDVYQSLKQSYNLSLDLQKNLGFEGNVCVDYNCWVEDPNEYVYNNYTDYFNNLPVSPYPDPDVYFLIRDDDINGSFTTEAERIISLLPDQMKGDIEFMSLRNKHYKFKNYVYFGGVGNKPLSYYSVNVPFGNNTIYWKEMDQQQSVQNSVNIANLFSVMNEKLK